MPFAWVAVLAAAMLLLPSKCRAARFDDSRMHSAAHGRTRQRLYQCNSCNFAAAIVAAAADGANWCTGCEHALYTAWAIDTGCGERDRRACRAWGLAVDRGRRIQGLRYDYDHQPRPLAHDRRDAVRGAVRARPGRCVAPGIGRGRGGRILRVAAPDTEKNQCKLVQLLQVLFSKG